MKKKLPKFKTEEEEIEFWDTHDATDYFDESDEVAVDSSPAREARDQVPELQERFQREDIEWAMEQKRRRTAGG